MSLQLALPASGSTIPAHYSSLWRSAQRIKQSSRLFKMTEGRCPGQGSSSNRSAGRVRQKYSNNCEYSLSNTEECRGAVSKAGQAHKMPPIERIEVIQCANLRYLQQCVKCNRNRVTQPSASIKVLGGVTKWRHRVLQLKLCRHSDSAKTEPVA